MKLSIIIPCKNEEGNVVNLYNKINKELNHIKYEIIFIDDGSTDNTMNELRKLFHNDMIHVKVLSFSRNFKKEAAMLAGLTYAKGTYTCIIDGDLQQNPSYLTQMMNYLDEFKEYDEVAMVMENRLTESKFVTFLKNRFYKLIDKISDIHFESSASDFRMFRTNVKKAILSISEKNRFTKGIFAWVGFNVKYLPYKVEQRTTGESKFNLKASFNYAIDGILAYSTKPLTIPFTIGITLFIISFLYIIYLFIGLINKTFIYTDLNTIILLILLLFSILFIVIGVLGIYLARTYSEVKNRPVYIIKEKLGFNEETIL